MSADRLIRGAPDPAAARLALDRLVAAGLDATALGEDEAAQEIVRIACTRAPYLVALLARDVRRLWAVARDPYLRREKPREALAAEAGRLAARDPAELAARLRDLRAREFVRLAARECGLGDRREVGRELAHLADAALEAAVRFHDEELARAVGVPTYRGEDGVERRARLVVVGMGKLGGEELNFASDIDLVYVYPSDDGAAGELSLHEYFDRLARRVTRALGELTEDGQVFRVDLRLRPEGSRGPLVNSLPSLERYYESWGRPWERMVWLKARPCAGDLALGADVLAMLEPFVYRRTTSSAVVHEVKELSRRVQAELAGDSSTGFDVKHGRGGIRQIEFFVQALQLVHAGKLRSLRERATRRALDKLLFAGLIAERERRALADAYDFLRHTEHLLQLDAGLQTHRLPLDPAAYAVVARRLGCADAAELDTLVGRHTDAVAAIFDTLGGQAALRPQVAVLLDASAGADAERAALEGLGFRDPEAAAYELEILRARPGSPLAPAAGEAAGRVAPPLLEELAASPDPDQALRFAVDLAARARGEWLWRLLDENRALLRLLASLFGTSAFLARSFIDHPELLDTLLLAGRAGLRPTRADLTRAFDERLASLPADADEGEVWNALRRVKSEEALRVGLADIAGELDELEVTERLTELADEALARTYERVRATLASRRGGGRLAPMAVMALGKLGGRELGYASDLDLVFVYDGGIDDHEDATRLAQRLVNALAAHLEAGRLYEVDTRLRPSGQKGTLVSSLAAWRRYHQTEARLWERQALIKARAVAGDPELGALVEAEAQRFVYEGPEVDAADLAAALLAMRQRMERELAHEVQGSHDIKTGRGGLVDIEFAAQFLQLVHGPGRPALRVRATVPALERAAAAGLVDEPTRTTLIGGYRFLRRLEHRMRIVHDRPIHELPGERAELDKLARRTGFASGPALERAYRVWTRDVRACYLKILGS